MDGHLDTLIVVYQWVVSNLIASIEDSSIWLPKAGSKGFEHVIAVLILIDGVLSMSYKFFSMCHINWATYISS
jgi:hypothetical protein